LKIVVVVVDGGGAVVVVVGAGCVVVGADVAVVLAGAPLPSLLPDPQPATVMHASARGTTIHRDRRTAIATIMML
jgi:hypothetical protein